MPIDGVGIVPTRFAALVSGAIDATILFIPWNFRVDKAGLNALINFTEEDLVSLIGGISLDEKLLRSDPELVEKFPRATLKGLLYARANRDQTVPILGRDVGLKGAAAARMYDLILPAMTVDGAVNKECRRKTWSPS